MPKRKASPKKKNLQQVAFTRFMLVVAVFVLWIGGISVRLVHLQVQQHEFLEAQAARQRRDVKRGRLMRGTIYDRGERILAMSRNVKTLVADATEIDDIPTAAKRISKVLGVKETDISRQLSAAKEDGRRYLPLAKGVDEATVQQVNRQLEDAAAKKAGLPKFHGLSWREDQKRIYPQQSIASHIVGFANSDGLGLAGIEQSQNELLYGAVIKRVQERDRYGRVYDETVSEQEPPSDVVLTVDVPIQFITEQALENGVKATGANGAIAVVIDNKTGAVLAMANYPTFDPNKLRDFDPDHFKNAAVQSIYSPGSVFKLITYGSALEKQLITPDDEIDSGNGTIEIARHRFRDSHAIGRVSYTKAMAHSSNVCAIKTAMRIGKDDFYGMIQQMGFGRTTGIELPAETRGIVRPVNRWYGSSLASMSIGYEIGVSALQMANAFATIANDGVWIQPHVIKEIRRPDGTVALPPAREQKRVVSERTARDLRRMLKEVVVSGTGKRAQLAQHTSAGKTGTAWKFDPQLKRVNSAKYVSSFIGFAPADNPAVTIAVVMDEPKFGGRDGGGSAAPVFREIAERVLSELKVASDKDSVSPAGELNAGEVTEDPSTGQSADEAISELPDQRERKQEKLPAASRPKSQTSTKRSPVAKTTPATPTGGRKPSRIAFVKAEPGAEKRLVAMVSRAGLENLQRYKT